MLEEAERLLVLNHEPRHFSHRRADQSASLGVPVPGPCPFLTPTRNATSLSMSVPWEENGWTTGLGPGYQARGWGGG